MFMILAFALILSACATEVSKENEWLVGMWNTTPEAPTELRIQLAPDYNARFYLLHTWNSATWKVYENTLVLTASPDIKIQLKIDKEQRRIFTQGNFELVK